MTDRIFFKDERKFDDRTICVTASRGYGELVEIRISDDGGEIAIWLHDTAEAGWLAGALEKARAAVDNGETER